MILVGLRYLLPEAPKQPWVGQNPIERTLRAALKLSVPLAAYYIPHVAIAVDREAETGYRDEPDLSGSIWFSPSSTESSGFPRYGSARPISDGIWDLPNATS